MPFPGDILRHQHFRFTDGTYGQKLLVVLNSAEVDARCLVLKTTSNPDRHAGCVQGCNVSKKAFYIPKSWQDCFPLDTYIQLEEVFELSTNDLLRGAVAKDITFLNQPLSADCFKQILDCLRHFRDDISERHWNLLFTSA